MSSSLETLLKGIAGDLRALKRPFAMVGGLAVSVRTEPRFTRDIDLAVSVGDDQAAERLVAELRNRGYEVLAIVEQEATGRFATVRLGLAAAATEGVVVDLLFASSGIEPELVRAAEPVDVFPDLSVPVAHVGHLLALKVLSRAPERPQDDADIAAMLAVARPEDIDVARDALATIVARGFNRDRDVMAMFEALLSRRPF